MAAGDDQEIIFLPFGLYPFLVNDGKVLKVRNYFRFISTQQITFHFQFYIFIICNKEDKNIIMKIREM